MHYRAHRLMRSSIAVCSQILNHLFAFPGGGIIFIIRHAETRRFRALNPAGSVDDGAQSALGEESSRLNSVKGSAQLALGVKESSKLNSTLLCSAASLVSVPYATELTWLNLHSFASHSLSSLFLKQFRLVACTVSSFSAFHRFIILWEKK